MTPVTSLARPEHETPDRQAELIDAHVRRADAAFYATLRAERLAVRAAREAHLRHRRLALDLWWAHQELEWE